MQIQSNIIFFCIRCMISLIREIQLNARREGDGRREGSRGSSRMRLDVFSEAVSSFSRFLRNLKGQ